MIAVLIAFYKRPAVTYAVMRHYRRLADARGDLMLVSIGSEGRHSKRIAEECGWEYVEAPNSPLSDKLGVGVACCRDGDVSGILAMGSDDIVTEPWVERCVASESMLGLTDMFLVRRATWEARYWPGYVGLRAGETAGAHRFFPRALLERLGWGLWPAGLNRNLDAGLTARLDGERPTTFTMEAAGCTALGISSDTNLTSWDEIRKVSERVDVDHALSAFPDETRAEVAALRGGQ